MSATTQHTELRELDHRRGDGFDVTLHWSPRTGKVYVAVEDARTGEAFRIAVHPAHALDAFHHPYAYGGGEGRRDPSEVDAALPAGPRISSERPDA
jgi:hypothetical protein